MGSSSPRFGVKMKNIWMKPPPRWYLKRAKKQKWNSQEGWLYRCCIGEYRNPSSFCLWGFLSKLPLKKTPKFPYNWPNTSEFDIGKISLKERGFFQFLQLWWISTTTNKHSSWLNQPIWKILVKLDHENPRVRGENNKYLKPPPRNSKVLVSDIFFILTPDPWNNIFSNFHEHV